MDGSDENKNPVVTKQLNSQGGLRMGGVRFPQHKINNNRRALSNINQNILGAKNCPYVVNKRGFSEKVSGQLRSNQQSFFPKEENEEPKPTTLNPKGTGDCAATGMEECELASDELIPMFVKHTEAMMDEIDQLVEVEMEDVEEDHVLDIDSSDVKDPLAVVEYIESIHAHYRGTEDSGRVSPNYMMRQFDINEKMRAILIHWLIEVHYKFKLMEETLFLTVNLIDRFLECETVVRKKLQLVGVTALLLACKYEEISVPLVDDLIFISDQSYTRKEILQMEKEMVNALQFNMSVPTPYVFMRRFLKAAQADNKLEALSFFIIELALVEYEMLKFPPSMLAAAAIFTAQCSLHRSKQWTKATEWHTTYTEDQLMDCSRLMVTYHQKAGTLNGVYKKYSSRKFGCVTNFEPAQFLLNLSV
ncbi:G2/mitotic-specific cyclin-2-like isoform X1 [Rhododendron vialii]|uniref:G2/mitotic-specific cyclin-2-like isoform X1 n=2 Tax=Rhododendron vialii TaxID=182163 RepID=UPI00265EF0AB|nr:G2/mitotic-specific cyclin-2-like isoform X1 [Rhododendron vialii]XP_058213834.1 G2/mitotic-specific cyclin-2-like isoform X1 [Rhododendron vialii]